MRCEAIAPVDGIAPEALELLGDGAIGIPEAVAFAGISRPQLYREMTAGRLPFVKVGRRRLIPRRVTFSIRRS